MRISRPAIHGIVLALGGMLACLQPARGDAVSETFGVSGNGACTHPGKLAIVKDKAGTVVRLDLSDIPGGAKVHHASLIMHRQRKGLEDRQSQWLRPVLVYALPAGADELPEGAKPLEFEAPWYRSLDVTEAVGKAVAARLSSPKSAKAGKIDFLVKEFYRWIHASTELRLTFEGEAAEAPQQVAGVRAFHNGGNTFITFQEIEKIVEKDEITIGELRRIRGELLKREQTRKLRYRVLRHTRPITAGSAGEARVLADLVPLSCANLDGGMDHWGRKDEIQNRFVIEPGKGKLPWGTGLYVHTTTEEGGSFYYAVVTVINGRANLKDFSPANAPPAAVKEKASPYPVPVLQLDVVDEKGQFGGARKGARVRLYVTWNAEPYTNLPNMAYNWCVAIDEKQLAKPAPLGLYLHEWAGTHVRTTWSWPGGRTGILVTGNDHPPQTWWYGWHEAKWTSRSWGAGKVHNYTERRVLAFMDWVATQWPVDANRVFAAGGSMGGAGVYTFCMRQGERFAMVSGNVGIANWTIRAHFTTALELCTGYLEWNTPASDAATVADRVNMTKWLHENPTVETPFLNCGNGKDDHGIGWPQAHGFFRALQETKRPHAAHWGLYGHGTGGVSLRIDDKRSQAFRLNQTLPAFTNCSLDGDIGTATRLKTPTTSKRRDGQAARDIYDGDPEGYYNAHLRWETAEEKVIDTPKLWQMTFLLDKWCKAEKCTADVTPRRCRKFKVKPAAKFKWTNVSVADGKQIQSGTAEADKHGLVTMEKVTVLKAGSRLRLVPAE